jgi:hypothetical protein
LEGARIRRRWNAFPSLIFLVGLGLRLVPVVLTSNMGIGLDDMFQYDMLGRSLASGNGFRWYAPADLGRLAPYLHLDVSALSLDPRGMLTTFRAPLYPAFVAGIYLLFGTGVGRFFAVRLAQTVLGALLAPLTYVTARRVFQAPGGGELEPGHEKAARVAACAVAVYPMLVIYPLGLATENLFFLLVLASTLVLVELAAISKATASSEPSGRRLALYAALAGVLLGLSALTRSVILPFAGAAILWIAFALKRGRAAAIAAAAVVITVLPWIVRNSIVAGRPTGIETSLGYNLYVGYHPQSTGTFTYGPSVDLLSILDDQARDQVGTQRAVGFIEQDPARFPYLALRRLGYFFNLDLRAFTYFYANGFLGAIPPPLLLLILALLGIPFVVLSICAAFGVASLRGNPASTLLGLLFGTYLLPHVFILSEERFHLTMIPIMAIWAAIFWTKGLGRSSRSRLALLVTSSLVLLLAANWALELARDGPVLAQLLGPNGNQLYLPY